MFKWIKDQNSAWIGAFFMLIIVFVIVFFIWVGANNAVTIIISVVGGAIVAGVASYFGAKAGGDVAKIAAIEGAREAFQLSLGLKKMEEQDRLENSLKSFHGELVFQVGLAHEVPQQKLYLNRLEKDGRKFCKKSLGAVNWTEANRNIYDEILSFCDSINEDYWRTYGHRNPITGEKFIEIVGKSEVLKDVLEPIDGKRGVKALEDFRDAIDRKRFEISEEFLNK